MAEISPNRQLAELQDKVNGAQAQTLDLISGIVDILESNATTLDDIDARLRALEQK